MRGILARSHQKYFTLDAHWMDIMQNRPIYNTMQHSHTSDPERMEIRFRQDQKYHNNKGKYLTQQNKSKIRCTLKHSDIYIFMESLKNNFHLLENLGTKPILFNVDLMAI